MGEAETVAAMAAMTAAVVKVAAARGAVE